MHIVHLTALLSISMFPLAVHGLVRLREDPQRLPITNLTLAANTSLGFPTSRNQTAAMAALSPLPGTEVCLYLTSLANWTGYAQNICGQSGVCNGNAATILPTPLLLNISSAGPSPGQTCFLYSTRDCTGDSSSPIVFPGYSDLDTSSFLNGHSVQSWRCWKYCGAAPKGANSTGDGTNSMEGSATGGSIAAVAVSILTTTRTLSTTTTTTVSVDAATTDDFVGGVSMGGAADVTVTVTISSYTTTTLDSSLVATSLSASIYGTLPTAPGVAMQMG